MPDNWGYVVAAYVLAAFVLGAYWRYLVRRARQLDAHDARRRRQPTASSREPRPHVPAP